jgi:hypothetical protein
MNLIQQFIQERKCLSFSILLKTFNRLCVQHVSTGIIEFDDILKIIYNVSSNDSITLIELEIHAYSGIIYESILIPCFTVKGPKLCLKEGLLGNEKEFLSCLLQTLIRHDRTNGSPSFTVQEFNKDTCSFHNLQFNGYSGVTPPQIVDGLNHRPSIDQFHDLRNNHEIPNGTYQKGYSQHDNLSQSSHIYQAKKSSNKFNNDHNDPNISKLLAHIRKSGMDIIFPQNTHDKVGYYCLPCLSLTL